MRTCKYARRGYAPDQKRSHLVAFLRSFLRLTMNWQLPGGEVAATACSWDADNPIVSLGAAEAAILSGKGNTFWTAIANRYPSNTFYVGNSVSWINTDGRTLQRIDFPTAPSSGTDGLSQLPNEVAWVVSLRTATAGRRTRGRMYLPAPSKGQVNDQGRYSTDRCVSIATAAATLLGGWSSGATHYTAVVASATGSLMTPVLTVAVGDVPDVQRRRRDRLVEGYSTHAVV
jgi:hypothetical protein